MDGEVHITGNGKVPQEEHLWIHPKQFHQSYPQPLSSHPHHSVQIKIRRNNDLEFVMTN